MIAWRRIAQHGGTLDTLPDEAAQQLWDAVAGDPALTGGRALMQQLKRAFDPDGRRNPGRFVA